MKIKQTLRSAILLTAMALSLQTAFAAGQIDFVEGNVSVSTADGKLRVPGKGDRIEPGDSISTGRDGEIHVHMDDNGLIALRANTYLKVEAYKADGGSDDNAVFRLLRGSFRSITGWIGKNNPKKYSVRTATATVGIRGTDHETLVIGEGPDAGTYDKVNTGETELATQLGKLKILPGQAGFTPKGGIVPPKILPKVPPVFVTSKNESKIEDGKKLLEESRDEMLEKKKKDNERKGADKDGKPRIGDLDGGRKALAEFEEFLRAFEAGDLTKIRQSMDPSMIGYQKMLNDIGKESNECKQMRVTILDTKIQAGPDITSISFNWEKRCLLLPLMTPQLVTGHSNVLMHLGPNGWYFTALTGTNPFAPITTSAAAARANKVAYTLAVLTVPTISAGGTSMGIWGNADGTTPQAFPISVTDPDLVGSAARASVNVTLTTNAGSNADTLVVTLLSVGPGQFALANVNFKQAATAGGTSAPICPASPASPAFPTSLEICVGSIITVSYRDQTTPSGVAQVVSKMVTVN
jgi:hypothetical protein